MLRKIVQIGYLWSFLKYVHTKKRIKLQMFVQILIKHIDKCNVWLYIITTETN